MILVIGTGTCPEHTVSLAQPTVHDLWSLTKAVPYMFFVGFGNQKAVASCLSMRMAYLLWSLRANVLPFNFMSWKSDQTCMNRCRIRRWRYEPDLRILFTRSAQCHVRFFHFTKSIMLRYLHCVFFPQPSRCSKRWVPKALSSFTKHSHLPLNWF